MSLRKVKLELIFSILISSALVLIEFEATIAQSKKGKINLFKLLLFIILMKKHPTCLNKTIIQLYFAYYKKFQNNTTNK